MDYNTAVRMARPGYCPAKRARIYNKRWYLCAFQNTSSDIGGGYYLEEGEHISLLPGPEARRARDAHLNHLNAIQEYSGPVFVVTNPQRGNLETYCTGLQDAEEKAKAIRASADKEMQAVLADVEKELAQTDVQILAMYGQCKDWPGNEAEKLAEHRAYLQGLWVSNLEYWQREPEIKQIK